jgi:hypothetical protein
LRRFSAVNMLSLNVILVPDFINIKWKLLLALVIITI